MLSMEHIIFKERPLTVKVMAAFRSIFNAERVFLPKPAAVCLARASCVKCRISRSGLRRYVFMILSAMASASSREIEENALRSDKIVSSSLSFVSRYSSPSRPSYKNQRAPHHSKDVISSLPEYIFYISPS